MRRFRSRPCIKQPRRFLDRRVACPRRQLRRCSHRREHWRAIRRASGILPVGSALHGDYSQPSQHPLAASGEGQKSEESSTRSNLARHFSLAAASSARFVSTTSSEWEHPTSIRFHIRVYSRSFAGVFFASFAPLREPFSPTRHALPTIRYFPQTFCWKRPRLLLGSFTCTVIQYRASCIEHPASSPKTSARFCTPQNHVRREQNSTDFCHLE
jgi:hypothetical protein